MCTLTPVTSGEANMDFVDTNGLHNEDESKNNTTRKRTASKSPVMDTDCGTRSGQKKFAKDNSEEDEVEEVIMIDDDKTVSESEPQGNVSYFNSSSEGVKPNAFDTSNRSEDTNSMSNEVFGIKDSLLADLKSLSKNWSKNDMHDVACQSSSLYLTPLVKCLFNANQSPGKAEAESGPPGAEGITNNYSLENNLFLRAIATKIDTLTNSLKEQDETMVTLDTTITQVEKFAEKQRAALTARIDENKRANEELRVAIGKTYEYTDTKISNLREAIPLALAEVGGDLERKMDEQNKVLLSKVQEELEKNSIDGLLSGGLEGKFRDTLIKFENQTEQRFGQLEEKGAKIDQNTLEIDGLKNELRRQREKTEEIVNQHTEQIRALDGKLRELTDSLNKLKTDDKPLEGGGGFITRHEWRLQKQRTQEAHDKIADVETSVKICSKKTDSVDIIVRKCNVIIDQLTEYDGEDISARVCGILRNTVRQEELDKIRVLCVFRLGVKRRGGPPRKVLLELDNPLSRDFTRE